MISKVCKGKCKKKRNRKEFREINKLYHTFSDICMICEYEEDILRKVPKKKKHIPRGSLPPKLTDEEYTSLLVEQQYCCAICSKHQDNFTKRLAKDHNHKTGKMRGLLCSSCNVALRLLKEDKAVILSMLAYIDDYNHP